MADMMGSAAIQKCYADYEEKALQLYLESNKESIMSEFGMETEEDWRFYMEGAFVAQALLQEYQGRIEAFDQLSIDEKLEKYPLGTATPLYYIAR